tara:strand:- start:11566 stop:14556 length:2991 start_codon:yes stop_codon:yes gene_type:complete
MQNIFSILKQAHESNPLLSGPEIDTLIDVTHEMINRGAPDVDDGMGFNKYDYGLPLVSKFKGFSRGDSIPSDDAAGMINILFKYKDTQVNEFSNYDTLKSGIISVINKATITMRDDLLDYRSKAVQHVGDGAHGSQRFLIPDFRKGANKLKTLMNQRCQELFDSTKNREYAPYNGKPAGFKLFSKVKGKIDLYDIKAVAAGDVADLLQQNEYDVSALRRLAEQINKPDKIKKVFLEKTDDGKNRVLINLGKYSGAFNEYVTKLPGRNRDYKKIGNDHIRWVIDVSPSFMDGLVSVLESDGFDASPLKEISPILDSSGFDFSTEVSSDSTEVGSDSNGEIKEDLLVRVEDATAETGGRWLMKVSYFRRGSIDDDMRSQFNDILKYNFVGWTTKIDEPDQEVLRCKADYGVYIRGTQNDFIDFARILQTRGFNVSQVLAVAQKIQDNGFLPEERNRGEVDGFDSAEDFDDAARKYESGFGYEFYKEQIDGIKFLYGNQSALLGDQVGVGKTAQFVAAADMRLKNSGGACIIVTVNSVVNQIARDVQKITGVSDDEISTDPYAQAKYRVLSYTAFSSPKKRKEITRHLIKEARDGKISVMVLDEVHFVKNGNPANRKSNDLNHKSNHTTFNIQEISQYIPFVWGVSATIVANKPVDLYNQLTAINHKLGKIKYKTFKYSFDDPSWDLEKKMLSADKLKEILLDQRVYIQRTKSSIREDMPEQIVSSKDAKVDMSNLSQVIQQKMQGYDNPDLAISAMIAFRTIIAEFKVPKSLAVAREAISQGKKVGIFTCYDGSAELLIDGLNRIVQEYNPGGTVARIHGGQRNRQDVIDNFKRPNSSDMAIVINIKAGGTGLDFPNIVTDVIVNDFDWSPSNDSQSLGRFFRINSEKDINISYIIANETEDRSMYQKLDQKRRISDLISQLSDKEMQLLNEGFRGDDTRIRELRKQRHKALREQANLEEDEADFKKSTGNRIIGMMDDYVIASRKSWYGILKTQHKH